MWPIAQEDNPATSCLGTHAGSWGDKSDTAVGEKGTGLAVNNVSYTLPQSCQTLPPSSSTLPAESSHTSETPETLTEKMSIKQTAAGESCAHATVDTPITSMHMSPRLTSRSRDGDVSTLFNPFKPCVPYLGCSVTLPLISVFDKCYAISLFKLVELVKGG